MICNDAERPGADIGANDFQRQDLMEPVFERRKRRDGLLPDYDETREALSDDQTEEVFGQLGTTGGIRVRRPLS